MGRALVVMERIIVMPLLTKSSPPDSKYLLFEYAGTSESGKTEVWFVYSKRHGLLLGEIKWYGSWRQYAFFPEKATIWNMECLSTINLWIGVLMRERQRSE